MTTNVTESKSSKTIAHTPGPWILKNHGINEPEYGHGIVHSFGGAHRFVKIENVGTLETVDMDIPKLEANARLIASAPELLRALERCTSYLADLNGSEWFANPKHPAAMDMQQRAKALQQIAFDTAAKATSSTN